MRSKARPDTCRRVLLVTLLGLLLILPAIAAAPGGGKGGGGDKTTTTFLYLHRDPDTSPPLGSAHWMPLDTTVPTQQEDATHLVVPLYDGGIQNPGWKTDQPPAIDSKDVLTFTVYADVPFSGEGPVTAGFNASLWIFWLGGTGHVIAQAAFEHVPGTGAYVAGTISGGRFVATFPGATFGSSDHLGVSLYATTWETGVTVHYDSVAAPSCLASNGSGCSV